MDCITGMSIGAYCLGRRVGQGGTSSVYAGHHRESGAPVAIKILERESLKQADLAGRFLQEANVCARMTHTNLVRVHEVGKTAWGAPYMVMDLLEGEDLQTFLERRPRVPWREACRMMRPVLQALAAIHSHGVVHRDIKPENCFLDKTQGKLQVRLLDFGIAQPPMDCRVCDTAVTIILGTPNYMAPEQARGGAVDGRADLYAAGVMFFRLLSGHLPYRGDSPADVIAQHLRAPIPSLYDVLPDLPVPRAFDRFLLKALAKHPAHRFSSADEMLAALDHVEHAVQRGQTDAGPKFWTTDQRVSMVPGSINSQRFDRAGAPTLRLSANHVAVRQRRLPDSKPHAAKVALVAAAAVVAFYGVGQVVEAIDSYSTSAMTSVLQPQPQQHKHEAKTPSHEFHEKGLL